MNQAQFEYSAGGVALDQNRVLVLRTTDLKSREGWAFPNGLLAQGERSPQAALREVKEETGYACEIVCELPKSAYWFRRAEGRVHKTVHYIGFS